MTPKEIARRADRIFVRALPDNWAVRSQQDQEDYGVDYEIELITPDDKATGFLFKIQQKGSTRVSIDSSSGFISFGGFSVEKLRYYLEELKVALVLVLVDTTDRRVYWAQLQGVSELTKLCEAAIQRKQSSLTIRISSANTLPSTADAMLAAVKRSYDALLIRDIKAVSSSRVLAAAVQQLDFEQVVDAVRKHGDILRLEQIERVIQSGDYVKAYKDANAILSSETETTDLRFAAGFNLLRVVNLDGAPSPKSAEARVSIGFRLLRLVRPSETARRLRLYGRLILRLTRLGYYVAHDHGLFASSLIQESTGNDFTRWVTAEARGKTTQHILTEFARVQVNLNRLVYRGHFEFFPMAWSILVMSISTFLARLRKEGLAEGAQHLSGWLEATRSFALQVATATQNWSDFTQCTVMSLTLADLEDSNDVQAHIARARKAVTAIEDSRQQEFALEAIRYYEAEFAVEKVRSMAEEDEICIYKQMAAGLGIDLDDPHDRSAQIVNIGLKDLNPERVLKNCRHIFVSLGSSGLPAQMLGLPTAGSKWIHCTKHGHGMMGLSLDGTYESFRSQHCEGCADCEPHAPDWAWTREWQQEQNQLHKQFAERGHKVFNARVRFEA